GCPTAPQNGLTLTAERFQQGWLLKESFPQAGGPSVLVEALFDDTHHFIWSTGANDDQFHRFSCGSGSLWSRQGAAPAVRPVVPSPGRTGRSAALSSTRRGCTTSAPGESPRLGQ